MKKIKSEEDFIKIARDLANYQCNISRGKYYIVTLDASGWYAWTSQPKYCRHLDMWVGRKSKVVYEKESRFISVDLNIDFPRCLYQVPEGKKETNKVWLNFQRKKKNESIYKKKLFMDKLDKARIKEGKS